MSLGKLLGKVIGEVIASPVTVAEGALTAVDEALKTVEKRVGGKS